LAVLKIVTVQDDDPTLRASAAPVGRVTGRVRRLMDDMVDTMRESPGVGLAAPQVGESVRVIVVETPLDYDDPDAGSSLHAVADPEIVWLSEEVEEGQEACLSIPGLYGDVPRAKAIKVKGLDRGGNQIELDLEAFEARVFQHEIDHLEGVLFPDRVTSLDKLYHIREDEEGELVRVPYTVPTVL
jgi:peptide deformylase